MSSEAVRDRLKTEYESGGLDQQVYDLCVELLDKNQRLRERDQEAERLIRRVVMLFPESGAMHISGLRKELDAFLKAGEVNG